MVDSRNQRALVGQMSEYGKLRRLYGVRRAGIDSAHWGFFEREIMKAKRFKQISDTVDQIRTPGGISGGIRNGLQELWEECGECLMLIEGAANIR